MSTGSKLRADIKALIETTLDGTNPKPVVFDFAVDGRDLDDLEIRCLSPDNPNFVNVWSVYFDGLLLRKKSREFGRDRALNLILDHFQTYEPSAANETQFESDCLAVAAAIFTNNFKDESDRHISINPGESVNFKVERKLINSGIVRHAQAAISTDSFSF